MRTTGGTPVTRDMLKRIEIPGLFVTGTDTGVGKTVIAGAIANWFARRGNRVGVLKPMATGCEKRREGLVSEDAEFLAHCADTGFPLDVICPERFVDPLAPAVAAEREGRSVDWGNIQRSIDAMAHESDCMIVEGVGGLLVPLDAKHTVLDLAKWIGKPTVVVARAGLGTISHTLMTIRILREEGVPVAGVVINQYPAESPGLAEETNPRAIEKYGKVPVLAIVPQEKVDGKLTEGIVGAVGLVDWGRVIG